MKRRNFLRSAASAFPLTLSQAFALAAESSDTPLKEAHLVPAGQDIAGELHTLGFSNISFKTSPRETNGNLFMIEHTNLLAGGPPLHFHYTQEEWFYVMEGEILFQVGEKQVRLKAGDSVLAPRKIPHAFTGIGTTPAKMLIAFTPAGKMEQFFQEIAHGKVNMMDAALFRRYDMEPLGEPRRYRMPGDMGQRVPVQKQKRRPAAAMPQADARAARLDIGKREPGHDFHGTLSPGGGAGAFAKAVQDFIANRAKDRPLLR